MKSRLTTVLVLLGLIASVLALSVSPAQAERYKPPKGGMFNIPVGNAHQRLKLERQIMEAIKHTKKGSRITIAAYSLDRVPIARALIAARHRGVKVRLLLNDHERPLAQRMLENVLGRDRDKKNFIWRCRSGCRAEQTWYNNLHSKFYLFSKTGKAKDVVMLGSQNMTLNAVKWQWNDLWTARNKPYLYQQYMFLFRDMKKDYKDRQPPYDFCGDAVDPCNEDTSNVYTRVFPWYGPKENDPVKQILDNVQCVYAGSAGKQRRTSLKISMHTMRGARGERLADIIRSKYAEGCDVRLIFGLMGFHVKQRLGAVTPRGRMPLRSTGFDINADGLVERYTHQKYLVIDGMYRGNPKANYVYTGSSNWATLGLPQDEIMVALRSKSAVKKWTRNFNLMWRPRYSRNSYTTTYATYDYLARENGELVTKQGTRKIQTLRSGQLRPGPTWEDD